MNIKCDLHSHTIASEHAYSTLQEMVTSASEKGLEMLAITDHGSSVQGAPGLFYFNNLKILPDEMFGVRILKGIEANIMDFEGKLDMPNEVLCRLDLVIASLHDAVIEPGTIEENTGAVIGALKNPFVDILGHADNPQFPLNYDQVFETAKQYGKAIELNNKSVYIRKGSEKNIPTLIKMAMKYSVPLTCSSDAHISFEVGVFEVIEKYIKEYDIPEELLLSTDMKKVGNFLTQRRKFKILKEE